MANRFKFASAALLGLALAAGHLGVASASPQRAGVHAAPAKAVGTTDAKASGQVAGKTVSAKTVSAKTVSAKSHRTARLHHARKIHVAHRAPAPVAGAPGRQHQAMAHRINGKASVIR